MAVLDLNDILAARDVVSSSVLDTPLKRSTTLSKRTGAEFYLKLENFQRTGSFKVRGALNKIHALTDEERARGVVAASAGNHAQGVAFAATQVGAKSDIFMPEDAPLAKVQATRGYGAEVHLVGRDYQEAQEAAETYCQEHDKVFVHAFNDPLIMAGQGTLGLEILNDVPDIDTVLVPIGGGGLIAGVATALKQTRPDIRVIGVQAAGASTVAPSLQKGVVVPLDEVNTMADGIACRKLGSQTFEVIKEYVDEVVSVEENEIAAAILFLLERTKVVAEGGGAVTLAAAMSGRIDLRGRKVCAVISGGNIDMTLLGRILQNGLVNEGRIAVLETTIPDKPGQIAALLNEFGRLRLNVLDIHHDRSRPGVPLHRTLVEVHVETRGPKHVEQARQALSDAGYDVTVLAD